MTAHADGLTRDQIAEARGRVPRAFARPALQRALIGAGWLALFAFVVAAGVKVIAGGANTKLGEQSEAIEGVNATIAP